MAIGATFSMFRILIFLTFPALTSCVSMGLEGLEAFAVGATATTATVIAVDNYKDENVKIYGNYNNDYGFWFDKEKFNIYVVANSQDESERIARELSSESCQKREKVFSILNLNNNRERPPFASIFDSKYATEIQFKCTFESAKSDPSSIFITTEDQDNSERLARELANESCQSRGENITIIKVDNYLRPISLLVLDKWYASDITYRCSIKTTEGDIVETDEPQSTPNNSINRTENTFEKN